MDVGVEIISDDLARVVDASGDGRIPQTGRNVEGREDARAVQETVIAIPVKGPDNLTGVVNAKCLGHYAAARRIKRNEDSIGVKEAEKLSALIASDNLAHVIDAIGREVEERVRDRCDDAVGIQEWLLCPRSTLDKVSYDLSDIINSQSIGIDGAGEIDGAVDPVTEGESGSPGYLAETQ